MQGPSTMLDQPRAHVQTRAYTAWASPRLAIATRQMRGHDCVGRQRGPPHRVPAAVYQAWLEELRTRGDAWCRWEALVRGASRGSARHLCWHSWGRQVTARGGKAPAAINQPRPPRRALRKGPDAHVTSVQDSRRQRSSWWCYLDAGALSPLATRPSTVVGSPQTARGQQRVGGGESGPSTLRLTGAPARLPCSECPTSCHKWQNIEHFRSAKKRTTAAPGPRAGPPSAPVQWPSWCAAAALVALER